MTIGLILDDTLDRSDGVQQAVLAIGKELSVRGHEVHYIVTETKRTDIKNIHSLTKYMSLAFNGNSVRTPRFVSRKKLNALFSDVAFDVLHVQMPYSPLFAARVLKIAPKNVKKIGTFHILPYSTMTSVGTKLLGWTLKNNKKLLNHSFAVSEPANRFMKSSFGIDDGTVLANPVDYSFYNSFHKKVHPKKQIVFVGRFEQRKGVQQLIEAYAKLPKELINSSELTMCGKGPMHEEMKSLAGNLGVSVNFPGFVSDEEKAQYLTDADIAVFPSISGESFGIVLTEAMSAGSGVTLGGNNPGYSSVLAPWPEAMFNPSDTGALSRKLEEFLSNDKLRQSTGLKQHEAAKQYDIKVIVDTLEDYYSKA